MTVSRDPSMACVGTTWLQAAWRGVAAAALVFVAACQTVPVDSQAFANEEGMDAGLSAASGGAPRRTLVGFERISSDGGPGDKAEETRPGGPAGGAPEREAPPARLMIYSARLGLQVASVEESIKRLLKRIEELGGYVERRESAMTVCRVPVRSFEVVTAEVRGYGRVLDELVEAADVTKQHRDLTIRLENAETSRRRLLDVLARAEKVEDILKIETELRRLTEEIERMTADLQSLRDQVAYSRLEVRFEAVSAPAPTKRPRRGSPFPWINAVGVDEMLAQF